MRRSAPLADAALTVRCGESPGAIRIVLEGHVQGVGFRPFVHRLAEHFGLTGSVRNRVGHVEIVVCGSELALTAFRHDVVAKAPPLARPRIVSCERTAAPAEQGFAILASAADGYARVSVPADCFLCEDCRHELDDPGNRRHGYPFINCTQCGPRYTLITAMPYDRVNTSMAAFDLCAACRAEYENPSDRRYHAEPIACADCGPQVTWRAGEDAGRAGTAALKAAVSALRAGRIVAVKGIGGYHLLCDATNEVAVATLRKRKQRPCKPLAVMVPTAGDDGLDSVRRLASPTPEELAALADPARPVVLVTVRPDTGLAAGIAPGLGEIGLFLPYSPLHQLLLDALAVPLIATSANLSGEPVLTDNVDAEMRLAGIADAFLHHDRPIVRPADDSVGRRIAGHVRPIRLGRGQAPLEMELPWSQPEPLIALGGQMKATVTLSWDRRAVVAPHIGEMDSPRSLDVLQRVVLDLQSLYGVEARVLACDAHPGYTTHRWAQRQPQPTLPVSHHRAHASALVAEAGAAGPWLVFTWDGTGYGDDGTLWGGEALYGDAGAWSRAASLRPFRLPGGDRAGREPWRSAAALHWACGRPWAGAPPEAGLAARAHQRGINSPTTSAAGRVFDAAAAMLTGRHSVSYEAEGPMRLEALCTSPGEATALPLDRGEDGVLRSDWSPLLPLLADSHRSVAKRAVDFHASMARVIVDQAIRLRETATVRRVGLTGGVFQNRVLTELAIAGLESAGFSVFLPRRLPCNDAALSLGQAAEIAARSASC